MTFYARFDEDGKLALPEQLTQDAGLRSGDMLAIDLRGDALVVQLKPSANGALDRLRAVMTGYSVDQFLAERKADWGP